MVLAMKHVCSLAKYRGATSRLILWNRSFGKLADLTLTEPFEVERQLDTVQCRYKVVRLTIPSLCAISLLTRAEGDVNIVYDQSDSPKLATQALGNRLSE
jgi:hypothetical protein